MVLEPAQIDLGGPQPLVANVRLTRQRYQIHYSGSALLQQLLPLAHAFNVVSGAFRGLQGNGTADYNLTVQGDWLPVTLVLNNRLNAPIAVRSVSVDGADSGKFGSIEVTVPRIMRRV